MSPEPCQGTSSACEFSYSPERIAGKKRLSPGLTRISDFKRECRKVSGRGEAPDKASSIGRAKSSKVTMVETGLPGRPKKYLCDAEAGGSGADAPERASRPLPHERTRPNTTGFPGWIFAPVKKNSACSSARTCSTRS